MGYKIFTDATADMPAEMRNGHFDITVLPMEVVVGEETYLYGNADSLSAEQFYSLQRDGKFASTSQIAPASYETYWRDWLELGFDILYLCFSSGMSGTLQSSRIAAEALKEEYPNRQIRIIDTLGASVGEGLLVLQAAALQARGMSLAEVCDWVVAHRMDACHWFTVDQFDHLQHGGRVSAAAAVVGTMLQIKPLLRVDSEGKLVVMQKPRGRKKAIASLVARMEAGWNPSISRAVIIGHGGNPDIAMELYQAVTERFAQAEVEIAEIGPVIGAHTGPDMLALTYWGSNR